MLIHAILFEVGHHISKSCLGCRLGSLLLNFGHLLKVLLGDRIELGAKPFLSLQRSCLRFRNLVDFEATTHSRVHHYLPWGLYLLQAIQSDIVKVASAVEISLLVSHNLLKKVVSTRCSLLSFQQQVIC